MTRINAIGNTGNDLIQIVYTQSGASNGTNVAMPTDNTKPQITEGKEVFNVSITPRYSTSLLLIKFTGMISQGTASDPETIALFKDAGADALAAITSMEPQTKSVSFNYVMTAGTTAAITFRVRFGPSTNLNTVYMNADKNGTRFGGGTANTSLTVYEFSV